MTHSIRSFSISRPLIAGLVLLTALTTACSDSLATAPDAEAVRLTIHAKTQAALRDTVVQTFTVSPTRGGSYEIDGVHHVDIQARSVCDPALSSYGPTEWDKPCTAISRPLMFTVRSWTDAQGHPRVSFSPDVRFVPGKINTLTLKDRSSSKTLATKRIAWCATSTGACIDEAASDASLSTYLENNGRLTRRVKHFSGYSVIAD